ncbi:MAG: AgmX/PglI C-terminal domain-containing protein [Sandaracinaceae bacterium]|nr:AgmX/PglI C-terminal domain-containing protein [Sandaracinaceae bacterium]
MLHQPKTAALIAYDADLLSAAGRARVDRHLRYCEACRDELASMRLYESLANDVKALPAPEVNWDKMELALRREARAQSRAVSRAKTATYAPLLGIAAAAALVAITVSRFGASNDVHEPVDNTPVATNTQMPVQDDGAEVRGVVMAAAGLVHRDSLSGATLSVGDTFSEGAHIISEENSELHARMLEGTGFVLASASDVTVTKSRERAVELTLAKGEVSSQVHHLGGEERYLIHAADYEVRVRGTRFSVKRDADNVAVSVDEGFVEVSKHGEVLAVVRAPGQWGSSGDLLARASGQVPRARGLEASALSWPTLTLPAVPGIVSWIVDGTTAAAVGAFALRVSTGTLDVVGIDARGLEIHASYNMVNEGAVLDTAHLFVRPDRNVEPRNGTIEAAAVRAVVMQGMDRVNRCYARWLRVRPNLEGHMRLRVNVGAHGQVEDAMLNMGSTEFPQLAQCITEQVRSWTFPAPTGGSSVSLDVPLDFAAQR